MELEEIVSRFVMAVKPIDDSIEHGRMTNAKWGEYLPGIGTAYEIDIRNELMIWWNKQFNDSKMQKEQPYPEKHVTGNCDVCIFENTDGIRSSEIFDWAIELKSVANIGDNGGINNYGLGKVVSPYKSERSSVHDCGKLSGSKIAKRKAIIIFGFEFDDNSVNYCKKWEEENKDKIPSHQMPPNTDSKGKVYPWRWQRLEQIIDKNTYDKSWDWGHLKPIFESSCKVMGINLTGHIDKSFSGLTRHPLYRKIRFLAWEVE